MRVLPSVLSAMEGMPCPCALAAPKKNKNALAMLLYVCMVCARLYLLRGIRAEGSLPAKQRGQLPGQA